MTGRSIALFVAAAICESGGAYLMWQAVKEGRGRRARRRGDHHVRAG
jgi:drug/metabolite transporter superfamily protein YnfA